MQDLFYEVRIPKKVLIPATVLYKWQASEKVMLMKKNERFVVAFATNQYDLMQSKQILEDMFAITLFLNDSSLEDGLLYRYRFPGNGHAKISLYENYMPEVDGWKDPDNKQYKIITDFLSLELDASEITALSKHFEYLYSRQI